MTLREWFLKAQKEGWALGAFNVDTLEILKGILEAAKVKKSPVIIEFSPGEVGYFGLKNVVDLVTNAKEEYKLPIFLNLDHGKTAEACLAAISESNEDGPRFDEVHFDGSELELAENIEGAKKVVLEAHKKGILVEGEIDKVFGHSQVSSEELNMELLKQSYTKVDMAAKFVGQTQVDIFAVVFGNVHGVFNEQPPLDFDLLAKVREALPGTFLAMHGGSGIPAAEVKRAIEVGKIVKVNVNTELRQAYKDALGEKMSEKRDEYAFYNISPDVVRAVQAVVEGKMDAFGSSTRAQ